jgi:subtilisin family serine protease
VAGIIAGCWESASPEGEPVGGTEMRDEVSDEAVPARENLRRISGVAPLCKIVSLKVIADVDLTGDVKQKAGQGKVSWVLMAIQQIQEWNQHGKRILVHGVNMSIGYDFDPRWFACGHSPVCVEVNRLVRSGVNVVVSAGNGGYSSFILASGRAEGRYSDLSITDPGNAALAVTVGSTHREMPHTYGVSYFSSRGPTGDGRMKPDLLAPGERIMSCAAGLEAGKYDTGVPAGAPPVLYCEQSGTSMAAPHVSGAIAAFLSVRSEFVGEPERVKKLLLSNAIDLGREARFQGAGLLDLMKVLQSV